MHNCRRVNISTTSTINKINNFTFSISGILHTISWFLARSYFFYWINIKIIIIYCMFVWWSTKFVETPRTFIIAIINAKINLRWVSTKVYFEYMALFLPIIILIYTWMHDLRRLHINHFLITVAQLKDINCCTMKSYLYRCLFSSILVLRQEFKDECQWKLQIW